jgi:hypothetical protein
MDDDYHHIILLLSRALTGLLRYRGQSGVFQRSEFRKSQALVRNKYFLGVLS